MNKREKIATRICIIDIDFDDNLLEYIEWLNGLINMVPVEHQDACELRIGVFAESSQVFTEVYYLRDETNEESRIRVEEYVNTEMEEERRIEEEDMIEYARLRELYG